MALASARAGNVIGGGDWAEDRLIADIMRSISKKEPVQIRNPQAIRPWQHVLEPLSGYLVLAQNLFEQGESFAQAFNFGPAEADAQHVEWIVKKLVSLWGSEASYKIAKDPKALHEATYLKLDCSKAKAMLQWEPRWNLEKTLESIVSWNKAYLENKSNAKNITLQQIEEYENTLGQN